MMLEPAETETNARRTWVTKRVKLLLRLVVPIAAFAYLLSIVPLKQLAASMAAVSPGAIAVGIGAGVLTLGVASLRWRLLFSASGIETPASLLTLFRLHMVGTFYNSYLPGGLGGDVLRAVATRHLVGGRGLPGALALVLLERGLGVTGLLLLVTLNVSLFPLKGATNVMLWSLIGLSAAGAAILGIVLGRRLAPYLPAKLARLAAALPGITSLPHFALALLLSVLTHGSVVIIGHAIVSSISTEATFTDSLVVLPLIGAAQYFPLTVGGAGVREAAFVFFYGLVGVAEADALAASLVYAAVLYLVAALGGLLHLLWPLAPEAPPQTAAPA